MLKKTSPLQAVAWKKLKEHYKVMKTMRINDLFSENPDRFSDFSLRFEDILVDYSKNIITRDTLHLLLELAMELNVKDAIEQLAQLFGRRGWVDVEQGVEGFGAGHVVCFGAHAADPGRQVRHVFRRSTDAETLEAPQLGDLQIGIFHVSLIVEENVDLAVSFEPCDGIN